MDAYSIRTMAHKLMSEHGLQGWTFSFNTNKNRVGVCRYGPRSIEMSSIYTPGMTEAQVFNTLTHEIAHALTPGHQHDAVWAAKHRSLGGDGKRCSAAVQPKDTYKWAALCRETRRELGRVNRKGHRLATATCKCHRSPILWLELR